MGRSLAAYAARLAGGWSARFGDATSAVLEGSLVKIDLSGFTRLSERLAHSSITGAEELNAVLNDVFGGLIALAHGRGGDVLQFGGDALLLWFEGPDHARRAAASTFAQHEAIRRRPAEQTPAGAVRLRMSAGIASGPVGFVVVGESHRELLAVGDTASRTTHLEHDATAGSTLVDDATAAALERGCVRRHGSAYRLVAAPWEDAWPATRPGVDEAAAFVPPEVRQLEEAGLPVGEHRRSAVAFLLLSDLDAVVAAGGVAGAHERLARVARAVEDAVDHYQVCWTATDLADDGAVFLLFAGAPVAREGDDERLLRACRAVLDACEGLPVRIGVNSGRVFAADIGGADRRTYAAIGDTTNLAARLMARTEPGTIQVSRAVIDRAGPTHELIWLEPFHVKGKRVPVEAALLGAERAPSGRARTHDLPLVGRDAELAVLRSFVDALASGGGPDVALVGEAGSGKSRLVSEAKAMARAAGLPLVQAAGIAYEQSTPYAAVRDALRSLLGASAGEVVARLGDVLGVERAYLPLVGLALDVDLPTTAEIEQLDEAFVADKRTEVLVAALQAVVTQPTLFVVEDLHWIDRSTAALLDGLAGERADALGLLATSRVPPGEVLRQLDRWEVLELARLGAGAARELLLAAAGDHPLSDEDLERLLADGDGNALFLRELARFVESGTGALPDSADEVIAARIDTLAPAERALLRDTAVVGFNARLDVLEAALGTADVRSVARWEPLSEFVSVVADKDVQFRHDLYRRSAYNGLATRRRREVHGRVADVLLADADPSAPLVALHLHEAARYDDAFDWARRAADEARAAGALADAAALYERALDSGRRAPGSEGAGVLAQVAASAGAVYEVIGHYDAALRSLDVAARIDGWLPSLLVQRATAQERQGATSAALRTLQRAARHPQLDDRSRVQQLLRSSSVLSRLGRLRQAHDAASQARALAAMSSDRHAEALALLRLEMTASEMGLDDAETLGHLALDAFTDLGDVRNAAHLQLNLGVSAKESGEWTTAGDRYTESVRSYAQAGDATGRALALNNLSDLSLDQGRLDDAEAQTVEARRLLRAHGHSFGVAVTSASMGTVLARRGRHDEARSWLADAREQMEAQGADVFVLDAMVRQVENEILAGDERRAGSILHDAEALRDRIGDIGLLALTVERWRLVVDACGDRSPERAVALVAQADRSVERGAAAEAAWCLDVVAAWWPGWGDAAARRDEIAATLGIVAFPPLPA